MTEDTNYDDWKIGDIVMWAIDNDPDRMTIVEIDPSRMLLYFRYKGHVGVTRTTNLKRITLKRITS